MKLPDNYVLGIGVVKPTAKGGFGQKMLEKLGWREGEGLGKNRTGIVEAIQTKQKLGMDGVGKKNGFDWANPFWENAYESALSKIKKNGASPSSVSSGSSGSSSSESEYHIQESKKRKRDVIFNQDGTVSTAESAELQILEFLSKGRIGRWGGRCAKLERIRQQEKGLADEARKKLGLPAANRKSATLDVEAKVRKVKKRQKRRDEPSTKCSAKHEKKSSRESVGNVPQTSGEEDEKKVGLCSNGADKQGGEKLEAAKLNGKHLGGDALLGSGSCKRTEKKQRTEKTKKGRKKSKMKEKLLPKSLSSEGDRGLEKNLKKKKKKKKRKGSRNEDGCRESGLVDFPAPTPTCGWWGAKRFISGGFAGQIREVIPLDQKERQAFDEDDQEKVFMFAHNSKRKGTTGIGCQ